MKRVEFFKYKFLFENWPTKYKIYFQTINYFYINKENLVIYNNVSI